MTDLSDLKTSAEVAELLGVPYRTLMRWVAAGKVTPHNPFGKRTSPRLWGEEHIGQVRAAMEKVTPEEVAALRDVAEEARNFLGSCFGCEGEAQVRRDGGYEPCLYCERLREALAALEERR